MPYLSRGGVRLRYHDIGAGEPVVLLHGFSSSFEQNWVDAGWIERLVGYRIVGVDLRGHGRSDPAGDYETETLAADVVAVLDAVGAACAHLVGFSMGAGVALQLALEHHPRVGAVAVLGIGDRAIRGRDDPAEVRRALRDRAAGRPYAGFLERDGWPGDLPSLVRARVPVFVVEAERDEFMAGTGDLVRTLGADHVVIAGSTHLQLFRDARAIDAVLAFLAEHSLAGTRG